MSTFKTYLKLKIFLLRDLLKAARNYPAAYLKFLPFEIFYGLFSLLFNPYRVSRRFLKKKRFKKLWAYGETPLSALGAIAKKAQIGQADHLLELGSGRGRAAFWLKALCGCSFVGIEQIGLFVFFSRLPAFFGGSKTAFFQGDFLDFSFQEFSVIYLYGSNLEEKLIRQLIEKFKTLKPQTKIITVSYALNDYDPAFFSDKTFELAFPWGQTLAYVNLLR
ncbi:MAG: class I SAM-dependent methyltransferase [Parachlamydiales bacterium]|jgi:hypothetical protein